MVARYSLSVPSGDAFRASHLGFIAALIAEAEKRSTPGPKGKS